MNTTAQPSSPSPKLQLTLNKQTLEIQMELNALLTSFGAPTESPRLLWRPFRLSQAAMA